MDAFSSLPRARPQDVGMSSEGLEAVRAAVRRTVDGGTEREGFRPNALVLVARGGKIVFEEVYGCADVERGVPLRPDSIFRLASLTKPVVAVAAMICHERGCFRLDDLLSAHLPEFAEMKVWVGGDADNPKLESAVQPITMRQLFTHTSGLQAAQHGPVPLEAAKLRDRLLRKGGKIGSLEDYCKRIAACPLVAEPGTAFCYANGQTILGRCVEVWSGQRLDVFLEDNLFGPLGMVDTGFKVPEAKLHRLVQVYARAGSGSRMERVKVDVPSSVLTSRGGIYDGAGGLVGTAADYLRFAQMLCNKGVGINGARIVCPSTVEMMCQNHLPSGADIASMQYMLQTKRRTIPTAPLVMEEPPEAMGHGLGVAVVRNDMAGRKLGANAGQILWSGAFNCVFYVDFKDQIVALWMTQLGPDMASGKQTLRETLGPAIVRDLVPIARL